MTSAFASAQAAALQTRRVVGGSKVVYGRGALRSHPFTAVQGQTDVDLIDAQHLGIAAKHVDWMCPTDKLDVTPGPTLPQRGDIIIVEREDVTLTYTVIELPGEPVYRYVDPGRSEVRVHTLLTSEVTG